ncbi:unnamed protein product [Peniophora sp. CBMAI 1063]|nr:unnamed protein product [Peniophora sp. CBMAI 1063]
MTVGRLDPHSSASAGDQRTQSAFPYASSVPPTPQFVLPYPPQPFSGVPQCPYGCPSADPHSGPHFPPGATPYPLPYGHQGLVYAYPPPPPPPFGYPSLYPSASQQAIPRKRQQVKTACTNCAAACKKCEEARPCDRCVKYNIADTCVSAVRKERKKGVKRGPYKKKEKDATEPKATETGSPTQSAAPVRSGSPAPASNGEVHSPSKYSPPPAFSSGVPPSPHYFPQAPEGHPYPYWYPPQPHYLPLPPLPGDAQDGRPLSQAVPPPYPYFAAPLPAAYPPYPLYPSLPYPPPPGAMSVPAPYAPGPASASSGSVASAPPTPSPAGCDTEEKHVQAREGVSPGAAKRKIIVWDDHPGPQPAAKRSRCVDNTAAM